MHAFSLTLAIAQEPFQTFRRYKIHEQVARALLEANANIEAVNNHGFTSLMKAAQTSHELVCAY